MPRLKKQRSAEARLNDKLRKRLSRSRAPDVTREKERLYKAQQRKDPKFKEAERVRNSRLRRLKRMDPEYKAREQARNTLMRRLKRSDPVVREAERKRNTLRRKNQDSEYRTRDKRKQHSAPPVKENIVKHIQGSTSIDIITRRTSGRRKS